MLYDTILKPRLPLLLHSFAISVAITIIKHNRIDFDKIFKLMFLTFSTLSVMQKHAPKIWGSTTHGIGFSTGMQMVGGGPSCNCSNPYTTKSILKVAVNQIPEQAKTLMSMHPATNKLLETALATPDNIVETEKPTIKDAIDLCPALENAGFNPKWTMIDIEKMKKTRKGARKLAEIDMKVKEQTGIAELTNSDIIACYPHFYTDYLCQKGIGKGKKNLDGPVGANDSQQDKLARVEKVPALKNCHWESFQKDLDQSITQTVTGTLKPEEQQDLVTTVYYLKLRTDLEVKNLINIFQSKTKKDWVEFLQDSIKREARGFHIQGTEYYIPWRLFKKYEVCFGINKELVNPTV